MLDHQKTMDRLLALPSCALITTGRTGTDFLQSLLDSHPQVLMFNGHVQFHVFWQNSRCVKAASFNLEDFLDEFIGHYIEKFKSRQQVAVAKQATIKAKKVQKQQDDQAPKTLREMLQATK